MIRDDESTGVTDAELVDYLDGELPAAAKAALETRIAASPAASARLDALRRRSARMSALLSNANPTQAQLQRSAQLIRPRMTQRATRWVGAAAFMKAAAGIVLLFGVAFALPPSRAWLVEAVRAVGEQLGITSRAPAPEAAVPQPAETAPFELGFAIATDTFDVHFAQAAGVLIIRRGSSDRVRAEAAAGVGFVALPPRGVRIESGATADARFILTLPPRVRAVRVFIGDHDVQVHAIPDDRELQIELATAGQE